MKTNFCTLQLKVDQIFLEICVPTKIPRDSKMLKIVVVPFKIKMLRKFSFFKWTCKIF